MTGGVGPSQPRAVLLDLDGTILDHERASRSAIVSVMAASGIADGADPDESISLWRNLEAEHFQRYLDGELDFEQQRIVRVRAFLESYGRVVDHDRPALLHWFEGYRTAYERAWRAFDDVQPFVEGLTALDAAPALAVVTNGDHGQQAAKLRALGLDGVPLYASSEIGISKPDRAIFLHACESLDVDPGDAWFVGDNREADALGAKRAGLHGVWLDRGGDPDARSRPARAATLLDVLEWIKELS